MPTDAANIALANLRANEILQEIQGLLRQSPILPLDGSSVNLLQACLVRNYSCVGLNLTDHHGQHDFCEYFGQIPASSINLNRPLFYLLIHSLQSPQYASDLTNTVRLYDFSILLYRRFIGAYGENASELVPPPHHIPSSLDSPWSPLSICELLEYPNDSEHSQHTPVSPTSMSTSSWSLLSEPTAPLSPLFASDSLLFEDSYSLPESDNVPDFVTSYTGSPQFSDSSSSAASLYPASPYSPHASPGSPTANTTAASPSTSTSQLESPPSSPRPSSTSLILQFNVISSLLVEDVHNFYKAFQQSLPNHHYRLSISLYLDKLIYISTFLSLSPFLVLAVSKPLLCTFSRRVSTMMPLLASSFVNTDPRLFQLDGFLLIIGTKLCKSS